MGDDQSDAREPNMNLIPIPPLSCRDPFVHGDCWDFGVTPTAMDSVGEAEYNAEHPPSMEGVLQESNKDLHKSFPETCEEYEREEYSSSPTNDEDVRMHILSQQLAKTAVSVRHMYKQLSKYYYLTIRWCSRTFDR